MVYFNVSKKKKSLEIYFRDWFDEAFGYGYGTGEMYIVPLLRKFLELCKPTEISKAHNYNHEDIEKALGKEVAWLMINVLCGNDIIEYGTSPRYAMLSIEGRRLKQFVESKTDDELYDIVMKFEDKDGEGTHYCYRDMDGCNCGPNGHQKGIFCANPFWSRRVPYTLEELSN